MTPEEHIDKAERLLSQADSTYNYSAKESIANVARAHIEMARYRQEFGAAEPLDRYESTR